jgi:outer membrane protein assembly factor BamD
MCRLGLLINGRALLIPCLLCLGLAACSRQQAKGAIGPETRLELADDLSSRGKCVEAVEQYEKLLSEFPTPQVAENARFGLGLCYIELEQYDLARAVFEDFIDSYPKSDRVDNAIYRIGLSYLKQAPRPERDQTKTLKALDEFDLLLREYPDSDVRKEAEQAASDSRSILAQKEYLAGKLYLRMGNYRSAHLYFESVLDEYGDTGWAAYALLGRGKAYVGQKRFDEAKRAFEQVIERFPASPAGQEAAGSLKRLEAAGSTAGEG